MIRTSAPFAFCVLDSVFCILQRQLTEMKEAAVTAMRRSGAMLAGIFRFRLQRDIYDLRAST